MNNFNQRAITGAVYVVVLLSCTFAGIWSIGLLFAIVCSISVGELLIMLRSSGYHPQVLPSQASALSVYALLFFSGTGQCSFSWWLLLIPLFSISAIYELYRNLPYPVINMAIMPMAILWIALPLGLLGPLVMLPGRFSPELAAGLFYMIWANDTGAYLTGRKFGRTKLFERISPKKTWEGFAGGALLSLITAYILSQFYDVISTIHWLLLGLITVITANFGDLTESLVKRSMHVKDSGTLMPGHGGFLDRFDSILMAVPFAYLYLYFVLRNG